MNKGNERDGLWSEERKEAFTIFPEMEPAIFIPGLKKKYPEKISYTSVN